MNNVAWKLDASKEGLYVGGSFILALLFVDDIVLLAKSRDSAERLCVYRK